MKFLLYTQNGDGLGLAWQLQREGNEVSIYFADKMYDKGLKGMIPEEKSLTQALIDKPIVIFDMVGAGLLADKLRRLGLKVFGAGMGFHNRTSLSDKLELNRGFSLDMMDALKIRVPEMKSFTKIDEAILFVKDTGGRWVIKPSGNLPTDMTFVAQSQEQLISQLEKLKADKTMKEFILQRFIPGIEMSTEVFFSNGKPVLPPNSTFETKKFLVDDLGPNTGCQTSVVWGYREREPRIYQKTLKKALALIEGTGYTGPLDINTIISKNDGEAYGLEFCPRLGYSAIYAMTQCLDMELGAFISGLAEGTLTSIKWKPGFGGSVRITVPPYPFDSTEKNEKKKIYAETKGIEVGADFEGPDYIPLDVLKQGDKYVVAGTDGVVMEAIGYGKTLQDVARNVYIKAGRVKLANKQYRTDMARNAQERWDGLVKMGYLRGADNGIRS